MTGAPSRNKLAVVLDSSALLALLWSEPGADAVEAILQGALMSAVNMAEVCSKLADRGVASGEVRALLDDLPVNVIAFDRAQAAKSGELRDATRALGLSLGDRACLALAMTEAADAVTADRSWTELDLDVSVTAIR